MLNRLRGDGENGAVLVLTALLLLVLMGFAALAVDAASAWSKRRQIETAADIGVLAGAEAIVGTFLSDVDAAVSGVVTDLVAFNSPEALAAVGPVTGDLDPEEPNPCALAQRICLTNVTVTVSGTSDNAFAPAIGAADTIDISSGDGEGTTEAQIYKIEYSSLKLFPIGIDSMAVGLRCGAPECRAHDQPTPPPPPSTTTTTSTPPPPPPPPAEPPPVIADPVVDEVDLVGVGRGRNCSDEAVAHALVEGVPHLVAVDAAAAVRDEGAACSDGHELTMPNAAYGRISEPVPGSLLAQGIHPVITTGPPLWTYLTGVGLCSGPDIEAITDPDPEVRFSLQTRAMQQCLRNGRPSFDFAGIDPSLGRLGWGIVLTDLTYYGDFVPVFVHSLVGPGPDYVVTESLEAGASGYTVFVLNENWVTASVDTEVDPSGRLSFKLID